MIPLLLALAMAAAPPPDTLRLRLDEPQGVTTVELACDGGLRVRQGLSLAPDGLSASAEFTGVPDASCTLFFKGGAPAQFRGVKGGTALRCTILGTTARCQVEGGARAEKRPAAIVPVASAARANARNLGALPPGALRVHLAEALGTSAVEVSCPSGARQRASGKTVFTVAALPAEDCKLHFKGGPPASYAPVRVGMELDCSFVGTTALCKPHGAPNSAPAPAAAPAPAPAEAPAPAPG